MTYRELAKLAGVSLSTVSKALSGSGEISEATAQRIRTLAEENGIRRAIHSRNPRAASVAILVPEIVSVFYAQIVTAINAILCQNNMESSIHICGFDQENYCKTIDQLCESGSTNGIIFLSKPRYCPPRLPVPQLFLLESDDSADRFFSNGLEVGLRQAIEHLRSLGHREIGFVGEKHTLGKSLLFRKVMQAMNLPVREENIFTSDKRFEEIGYEAARYFLSLPTLPTALITAYDEIAIGAIHAFSQGGLKVPEELSVVGINDIPGAAYASVPLTTIKLYNEELLSVALKLLIDNICDSKDHPPLNFSWQCQLMVRSSTAEPRKKEIKHDERNIH